jgi:hypothetical protein
MRAGVIKALYRNVVSAFRRTVITVRLKPDTTYA